MDAAIQYNLFDIPATEPKRVRSKWDEYKEMCLLSAEVGSLVPLGIAAVLLDVSYQRVHKLCDEGRLRRWEFFGKPLTAANDINEFMHSERKSGRPAKFPETGKEIWKSTKDRRRGK